CQHFLIQSSVLLELHEHYGTWPIRTFRNHLLSPVYEHSSRSRNQLKSSTLCTHDLRCVVQSHPHTRLFPRIPSNTGLNRELYSFLRCHLRVFGVLRQRRLHPNSAVDDTQLDPIYVVLGANPCVDRRS